MDVELAFVAGIISIAIFRLVWLLFQSATKLMYRSIIIGIIIVTVFLPFILRSVVFIRININQKIKFIIQAVFDKWKIENLVRKIDESKLRWEKNDCSTKRQECIASYHSQWWSLRTAARALWMHHANMDILYNRSCIRQLALCQLHSVGLLWFFMPHCFI